MGLVEGAIGMSASYRDLRVWQQAMELVVETYKQTRDFPKTEIYGLTIQMKGRQCLFPLTSRRAKDVRQTVIAPTFSVTPEVPSWNWKPRF
jgi:hypothetical protein